MRGLTVLCGVVLVALSTSCQTSPAETEGCEAVARGDFHDALLATYELDDLAVTDSLEAPLARLAVLNGWENYPDSRGRSAIQDGRSEQEYVEDFVADLDAVWAVCELEPASMAYDSARSGVEEWASTAYRLSSGAQ